MSEKELKEIIYFKNLIEMLNKELYSKKIYNIEYLLINNTIEDVVHLLEENSEYYQMIKDDKYSNGVTFSNMLEVYCQLVQIKYNDLLINEGKDDRIVDKYYKKLKEPTRDQSGYLHYSKNNVGMIQQDIEKTLLLMKEAILAYYKVYYNKKLIAELTTNNLDKSDYLEFVIREDQLLHLLGITVNQLRNNPDFIKLTGKKYMSSSEILEWILKDMDGNSDLMQYSEDFLKRISKANFYLSKEQFSPNTQTQILNYHKIRAKSQTFLKYGPFEKVSLVSKLKDGKKMAVNSKSNTAMITRAESFKKYPWAYFGSVQTPKEKYIETLIIDNDKGKKELFKGSKPSIVKGIFSLNEENGEGGGIKIFSAEEQFDLFCQAYDAFKDTMNFKNLMEYFVNLFEMKEIFKENEPGKKK